MKLFLVLVLSACVAAEENVIVYPQNVRSERDLPVCATAYTACSVVQRRFWLPSLLYRYCRCADRSDCPSDWADATDNHNQTSAAFKTGVNYSQQLNNRAQLKFCDDVRQLPVCLAGQDAVFHERIAASAGAASPTVQSTRVNCRCPVNHAWNRHHVDYENDDRVGTQRSLSTHRCSPLRRCRSRDTCAFITVDTFSSYYRCSCPRGSQCVINNRQLHDVHELHYNGMAYFGSCKPI